MEFTNVSFKNIKGIPIDSVETRTLADMGFPVDVCTSSNPIDSSLLGSYSFKLSDSPYLPYGTVEQHYIMRLLESENVMQSFEKTLSLLTPYGISQEELKAGLHSYCLLDLNGKEAQILLEEFTFIIKTLLPRQLTDIYYCFDLKPNPAYSIFFELAADALKLPRYTDKNTAYYNCFTSHTNDGVKQRIADGESLQFIYENTCATKDIIKNVLYSMPHNNYDSMECVLFSLSKQYRYTINTRTPDSPTDFSLYRNGDAIFDILLVPEKELKSISNYDQYIASLNHVGVPVLVIDAYELENDLYNHSVSAQLSTILRKALSNPDFIAEHNANRCIQLGYFRVPHIDYTSHQSTHRGKIHSLRINFENGAGLRSLQEIQRIILTSNSIAFSRDSEALRYYDDYMGDVDWTFQNDSLHFQDAFLRMEIWVDYYLNECHPEVIDGDVYSFCVSYKDGSHTYKKFFASPDSFPYLFSVIQQLWPEYEGLPEMLTTDYDE